ncbi:MAG: class I SAM-dependent methyltransferase [bacterium]|nr:class I SAM-dependent methyltransferase [bacterium]
MSAFRETAALYDVLARKAGRIEREGPFLTWCLEQAPGNRVADLACGTGLHAQFLAERGAEVAAFDLSEEMIAYASQARAHPRIDYRTGDMREIQGGPWDLLLCLGNSLSLLSNAADLTAFFEGAAKNVELGGVLVTQSLNYAADKAQKPRHRTEEATEAGANIVAVKSLVPHGDVTYLTLNFFVEEEGDVRTVAESAVLRHWTPEDLKTAAHQAGLEPMGVFGSYDRSAFDPAQSGDIVAVFRRV